MVESGGGVEVYGSVATTTLRDCVIRRNSAGIFGGGLVVANGGSATLENCEITGNSAGNSAGGVALEYEATLETSDSKIRNNTAPDGADGSVSGSASALLMCCDVELANWTVDGTLAIDDENCSIATEDASWGRLKSRFR